ncbi:hypothetical protein [Rufibacter hautae]|uniref:DUF4231 domain-containing protein n=1 Tax=Rufibacter hautae TaxID=2595005 RepID=A0A5B6TGQ1_9BACT|nr:hypothetical protein [Rufibacter hautae]KAA3439571.1 hypothetical protein FOA19_02480 [Rufibacter hautae]
MSNHSENNEVSKYKEVGELLDLAENVSEKVKNIQKNLYAIQVKAAALVMLVFIISLIFFLAPYLIEVQDQYLSIKFVFIIFFISSLIFYGMIVYRQYLRYIRDYRIEQDILLRLLEMTHQIKKYEYSKNSFSTIEKALIEMRLSRIDFNT